MILSTHHALGVSYKIEIDFIISMLQVTLKLIPSYLLRGIALPESMSSPFRRRQSWLCVRGWEVLVLSLKNLIYSEFLQLVRRKAFFHLLPLLLYLFKLLIQRLPIHLVDVLKVQSGDLDHLLELAYFFYQLLVFLLNLLPDQFVDLNFFFVDCNFLLPLLLKFLHLLKCIFVVPHDSFLELLHLPVHIFLKLGYFSL